MGIPVTSIWKRGEDYELMRSMEARSSGEEGGTANAGQGQRTTPGIRALMVGGLRICVRILERMIRALS